MKKLTLKQALAQGYFLAGNFDSEAYTELKNKEEIKNLFLGGQKVFLAEKECACGGFLDAQEILSNLDESLEIHESGLEKTSEIISSYENKLQRLLDEMYQEIIDKKATNTYELTNIELIQ